MVGIRQKVYVCVHLTKKFLRRDALCFYEVSSILEQRGDFMAIPAEKVKYSFADCLTWGESVRAEIIDGEVYLMSPPKTQHQRVLMALAAQLHNYLDGKRCEVFPAPFGVRLFEETGDNPENVDTMVEPDVSVVCEPDQLDEYGCKGAPAMVIEILSPSTQRHDRITKFNLYQKARVKEYWIVDPISQTVQVFLLNDVGFLCPHEAYGKEDTAKVNVLDGCLVELNKVFAE